VKRETKYIKKHKFEYLFGERYLAFVEFPDTVTVREMEEKLFWAKAYYPIAFTSKGILVRCHVKLFEWNRFVKENRKRLKEYKLDENIGSVVTIKDSDKSSTIYEL